MGKVKNKMHFAWFVLIGLSVTVGLAKAGLNNTAGLFVSPVSEEIGVGVGNLTLYLSISAVVTMLFLPIGGKLMSKYSAKAVLIGAITFQAGSFALFGLMSSVWGWYILAVPLAVGGVFTTVIAGPVLIQRWFKKKNGMALGILTASGGLLGAFSQPIAGNLIANFGWRTSYIVIGIAVLIIVVPAILLLIKNNPQDKGLLPYGADSGILKTEEEANAQESGIAFKDANKSPAFFLLLMFFFIVTSIASFSIHIPTYLVNQGYEVAFAGNAMGSLMVGVLLGSLTFGYLSDKIGSKITSIVAMIIGLTAVTLLLVFPGSVVMLITGLTLFGFTSSSIGTLGPALTSTLFGGRDYSQIYSTASIGLALASIVAIPAYGYIFDFTGSYLMVFYIIIAMFILNIIFITVAFKNKDKMVKEGLWK